MHHCRNILISLPKENVFMGSFWKEFLLEIVKHIFGFWVRLLFSWKVFSFLYIHALRILISGKIRQVWKFNILWASSKTKFSNLLNARHRENCHGYLLRTFLSASLQKWSIMFLIYLNGYKHVTQPLYFWRKVAFICLSFFSEFLCGKVQQGLRVVCYEFECMCYEIRVTRLKARVRRLKTRVEATKAWINPNKAGIFESSFSWGGGGINLTPLSPPNLHITRRTCLISI